MKKYAIIFSVSNVVISLLLGVTLTILDVGGSGTVLATVIAASLIAAWRFIKDHNRLPTEDEKSSYAKLSLLYITIASVVAVFLYMLIAMPEELVNTITSVTFLTVMLGVLAIFSLIYYFAIKLSFSWYVKWYLEKQEQI